MKVKKFRTADRAAALKQIRDELGPQAVIVHEQRVRPPFFGLFGKPQVEMLAALEDDHLDGGTQASEAKPKGVDASISAAARQLAADAASAPPLPLASNKLPSGLSHEGASKLAAILETFPKSGQPLPPAMAASLADLVQRAMSGQDLDEASAPQEPARATVDLPQTPTRDAARTSAEVPATGSNGAAHGSIDLVSREIASESSTAGQNGTHESIGDAPSQPSPPRAQETRTPGGRLPRRETESINEGVDPSLGAVHDSLAELRRAVDRLTQQNQDAQLPREAPALRAVYQHLILQEIDPGLALDITGTISDELSGEMLVTQPQVLDRVVELLVGRLRSVSLQFPAPALDGTPGLPAVVVLVGPTGVGKTTTLAKLASHLAFTEQKHVVLITTDTFRIAAAAQLGTYADILELPFEVVYRPEDLPQAIQKHHGAEVILVDTPGCGQQDQVQIGELSAFVSASLEAVPDATVLLTVSAPTKLRDLLQIQQGFGLMPIHGLILTKLDETETYGPIVSFATRSRKPVYYLTTGQKVPSDIEEASEERIARLVVSGLGAQPRLEPLGAPASGPSPSPRAASELNREVSA